MGGCGRMGPGRMEEVGDDVLAGRIFWLLPHAANQQLAWHLACCPQQPAQYPITRHPCRAGAGCQEPFPFQVIQFHTHFIVCQRPGACALSSLPPVHKKRHPGPNT